MIFSLGFGNSNSRLSASLLFSGIERLTVATYDSAYIRASSLGNKFSFVMKYIIWPLQAIDQ
jgi:uncharacterized membrane protein SirB2